MNLKDILILILLRNSVSEFQALVYEEGYKDNGNDPVNDNESF
ncbi:hypothetical protein [Dysgonomonas macrotermitis]|nr:hypothetical protein [Dysgonomonas macrotermitis]